MITIISCTNRKDSKSLAISRYYKELLDSKGVESQILDLNLIPEDFAFSALYQNQGKNPMFNTFLKMMNTSDKFVFVIPEYNGSFPGVLKTFVDGLDFPAGLKNKKCALLGISSGTQGSSLAMSHFSDILNYLGVYILPSKPRLTRIETIFKEGKITDKFLSDLINLQAEDLIKF